MKFLLDTNICSYFLKQTHPELTQRILRTPAVELGISAITWTELRHGAERSPRKQKLDAMLAALSRSIAILPFDTDAAAVAGTVLAELRTSGSPIGAYDVLIAGHARALGLTLITHNTREFRRVKGLKLADWAAG